MGTQRDWLCEGPFGGVSPPGGALTAALSLAGYRLCAEALIFRVHDYEKRYNKNSSFRVKGRECMNRRGVLYLKTVVFVVPLI